MNRIVDFHTHYTGGKLFASSLEPESVMADMDANSVALNLLLPLDGLVSDPVPDNDQIASLVARHPDRFAGLGTVNPREPKAALDELKTCLTRKKMIGMKFHPWLQAFHPMDPSFLPLAEEANSRRSLFFFHDGTPPYSEPFQIAELARTFPSLTVVLGHSGLNDLWRESLAAAEKHSNIWLCFCGCPYGGMQEIVRRTGGERVVWGSDYPLAKRKDVRDRIRQVENLDADQEVIDRILFRNARDLLNRHRPPHEGGS